MYWLVSCALFAAAALPAFAGSPLRTDVALLSALLGAALAIASTIDVRSFILPNSITLPLIAAGPFVTAWFETSPVYWSVASAALGYGLFWAADQLYLKLRGQHGIGMGDAKLLAAAGAWLGAEALPTVMLWATGLALAVALLAAADGRHLAARTKLPFGPALAMGFWLTWLYGALA